MSTPCPDKTPLMHQALDDELSAAARAELWRHFAACPPCRREFERLGRAAAFLAAAPGAAPNAAFAARVMTRIRLERALAAQRRRSWAFAAGAFAAGAAVALAAVWGGVIAPTISAFGLDVFKAGLTAGAQAGTLLKAFAAAAAPLAKVARILADAAALVTWEGAKHLSPFYGAAAAAVFLLFILWRVRRPAARTSRALTL